MNLHDMGIKPEEALIAVIVPIYNAEKYLRKCVQSIFRQTHVNLEIILVDDGSTDDSYKVCTELSGNDTRIKVLRKENGGPLSAKVMALENTNAEYIMFVDADDWIKPEMCETLYKKMIEENVDLVTSGIVRYFSDEKCIYDFDNIAEGKYCDDEYQKVIIPHMLCDGVFPRRGIDASLAIKIFKKKMLYPIVKMADEKYGYLFAEDTAVLYPYMLNASSVYIMKECFYYHRQNPENRTKYYEDEDYQDKLSALYMYIADIFRKSDHKAILMKQLECFIYGSLITKAEFQARKIIDNIPKIQQYLFPFGKVKRGSRVLLYGAGEVGRSFYAQMVKTQYCEQIIWQDRQFKKYQEERLPVECVNTKIGADICVIAVQDKKLADEIKQQLIAQGMERGKIIWENPLLNKW